VTPRHSERLFTHDVSRARAVFDARGATHTTECGSRSPRLRDVSRSPTVTTSAGHVRHSPPIGDADDAHRDVEDSSLT